MAAPAGRKWLGLVLLIAIGGLAYYVWSTRRANPPAVVEQTPVARDPISTPLSTPVKPMDPPKQDPLEEWSLAGATYVGSESCANCHVEESSAYALTSHHRSFRPVDLKVEPPDGELTHTPSRRSYRIYRSGEKLHHQEFIRGEDGTEYPLADHAVRYVVGSGEDALTYLAESNGFLMESPVTWYASQQTWKMSPGFESFNSGFARPVYLECLFCHTSRVSSVEGSRAKVQIESMSIDCERCHGPGSKHVAVRTDQSQKTASDDNTIIHPGKLSRARSEDVCSQCHLHSAAEAPVHGRRIEGFRPGMSLRDFRIDFAIQEQGQPMTVVGHTEQLRLSRCYQSSESMRCVTCHDPHRAVPVEQRVEHYRKKCLTCHTDDACGLKKPERLSKSAADNCMECHMPSSSTDIPHVASHHHRIGIHTAITTTAKPQTVRLVPLSDVSHLTEVERDRCLGLAYLSLSQQNADPQVSGPFRQSAQQILKFVIDADPQNVETIVGLAQTYLRQNPQRVVELANQALANPQLHPDDRIKVLFALSDSHLVLGKFQAAIPPLQELVKLRRQASDWLLLAVCQLQLERIPEALVAATAAAEIRPDRPNHHALLAELYGRQNQTELAAKHKRLAELLAPPAPPVQTPPGTSDSTPPAIERPKE